MAEAAHTDADHLARLGQEVLARVAPEAVEGPEAERRLDAQQRRARANRCLSFTDDGDGSYRVAGLLPHLAATPLIKLIDARIESSRRARREASPSNAERPTPAQGRADALCDLARELGGDGRPHSPRVAGGRPRVVVTMGYDALRERAEQAGVIDGGRRIGAGDLRRLACDCDLVAAVLGERGVVLDYGRAVRLVPPELRQALALRDDGCVFPGCGAPDQGCEAHHVVPWWRGGPTALSNLVLLCPHHHATVEPPRFWAEPGPDRWQVRFDCDGLPEFLPPRALDPRRAPLRHRRHRARGPDAVPLRR